LEFGISAPPVTPTAHTLFSPARLRAIASNTLLELVRLKVFYFLLLFALLIIGSSAFVVKFSFQEQFQVLKDVALGSMSVFTWLLAVLSTALLLPKDIEERTLYTILAKPVPRLDYLLGKLLGVLTLLFLATSLMSFLFVGVLYYREQGAIAALGEMPPDDYVAAVRAVKASTFSGSLAQGIVFIYLKAALCASFTLLLSTFASTTIFTIIVSVVVYFIGHVQALARDYWLSDASVGPLTKIFLAFVSLVFPDLQLFNVVDDIAAGASLPHAIFLKTSALGVIYIAVYFLAGYFLFQNKEL
jgi:ABC-type transport system involved in multi-copper enzyme maturation permease subunit